MKSWRVGIVGAGLIGTRRARVAHAHPESAVVAIADADFQKARNLADEIGARAVHDWEAVTEDSGVSLVIVATPTDVHAPVALRALQSGKHVLCEKPLARNADEALSMVQAADSARRILKTGFNHRHHPAILKAHEMVSRGELGRLLFARGVYGHGGRRGYENEWRMKPEVSGGGELLDQGIHLLDLLRWFLGEFVDVCGVTETLFWPIRPVEDNAFAILRAEQGAIAQLHASWTQWKNRFSFEVYGERGYVRAQGLGGSYGNEELTVGTRSELGQVPQEERVEFRGPDGSWELEWEEFLRALRENREPLASGRDGLEALRLVQAIYTSSASGRRVVL